MGIFDFLKRLDADPHELLEGEKNQSIDVQPFKDGGAMLTYTLREGGGRFDSERKIWIQEPDVTVTAYTTNG